MYIPEIFEIRDNKKAIKLIENNSFGDLITSYKGLLTSNKVPFFYDRSSNTLCGHFGKSNPQLIDIKESKEVLAVFTGPQCYISPQFYESSNMVPTWNFQTVQIRGNATIVDDNRLINILEMLSKFHESQFRQPWSISQVEPDKFEMMLDMIVGFQINITEIKFKEKMSQNRSKADQLSVIKALKKQNNQSANNVVKVMRNNIKSK
ncbi:MAG: FMN-binding negative transcriptional regulator [Gammaproteobacteria bacterium]|nr:FMN-binding negative transcriptional regulator [Gammaproteobacteria bacterium]